MEPQTDKFFKSLSKTDEALRSAKQTRRGGTFDEKIQAVETLSKEFDKAVADEPGAYTTITGGIVSLFTDAKSPSEMYIENLKKITAEMDALNESMAKTRDTVDKTGGAMNGLKENANDAAGALGNGSGGSDSSRGTSHLGANPGSEPARG